MSDNDLIRRCLDDRLSAEEFASFNERLRTDANFRKRYVRLADLEASFYDECDGFPKTPTAAKIPNSTPRIVLPIVSAGLAIIACLVVLFVQSCFLQQPAEEASIVESLPGSQGYTDLATSESTAIENPIRGPLVAAVLVVAESIDDPALTAGKRFKPGVLELTSGYVQLEFMSGAILGLTGPARLHIESKDSATLLSGQVTAYVPDRARGFVLNAPGAAIVDLGTEFGVRINDSGVAEVDVLKGEVELSLLGDDGNTLVSQRVNDTRSIRVDTDLQSLTEMPRPGAELPRIRPSVQNLLPVSDQYVKAVRNCDPLVYWRFEQAAGTVIRNEVSDQWSAIIHTPDTSPDSITVANGHVSFSRTDSPRFLSMSEGIPGLNERPFSIEFWMRPDDLAHATTVGIYPEKDTRASVHLNVIEIVTDTFMIHEPGAMRFLHRNPPQMNYELGKNVFSDGICVPQQWQHVVAVKESESLILYFNGQLAQHVHATENHGDGIFQLLIGQLKTTSTERQYSGDLDELAIYPRSLTPEEIEQHFILMAEQM